MLSCNNLKNHFRTNPRLNYTPILGSLKIGWEKFLKLSNVLANVTVAFRL